LRIWGQVIVSQVLNIIIDVFIVSAIANIGVKDKSAGVYIRQYKGLIATLFLFNLLKPEPSEKKQLN